MYECVCVCAECSSDNDFGCRRGWGGGHGIDSGSACVRDQSQSGGGGGSSTVVVVLATVVAAASSIQTS